MPSAPSTPAIAPASEVASQQTAANQQAQQGSAVNQNTAYGSLNYTTDPTTGKLVANQNLSPAQQALLNTLQGTQQTAGSAGSSLLTNANYGGGPTDLTGATNDIVNKNLANYTASLQPTFDSQTSNLDNQLRNQGLTPGTPAYDQALNTLRQNQNQSVSGFLAQAEPTAFNQAESQYNLPLQTATSLAQLGAPASLPSNLINTPTQSATNVSGIYGQQQSAEQQQYQNQIQQNSALLSGLFGIGGSILGGPVGSAVGSGLGSATSGLLGGLGGLTGPTGSLV